MHVKRTCGIAAISASYQGRLLAWVNASLKLTSTTIWPWSVCKSQQVGVSRDNIRECI